MKAELRVLGFDDAPFRWEDIRVPVVGVVTRGPASVEAVLRTDVEVDGVDATDRIVEAVVGCDQRPDLRAVLLDGCAFGGFNVVDPAMVHAETGIPVLTITKGEPDWTGIHAALKKHHADWEDRWRILAERPPEPYLTEGAPLYVRSEGLTREETADLLHRTTSRGHVPEALRVAHLVARILAR